MDSLTMIMVFGTTKYISYACYAKHTIRLLVFKTYQFSIQHNVMLKMVENRIPTVVAMATGNHNNNTNQSNQPKRMNKCKVLLCSHMSKLSLVCKSAFLSYIHCFP